MTTATLTKPGHSRIKAGSRMPSPRKPIAAAKSVLFSIRELRDLMGLPRPIFGRLMGCSERALANWETGKPIQEIYKHRLNELRKLYTELADIVDSKSIGEWLTTPNEEFDGLKPVELIERGEMFRIWRMLFLLKSGTPA